MLLYCQEAPERCFVPSSPTEHRCLMNSGERNHIGISQLISDIVHFLEVKYGLLRSRLLYL